MFFNLFKKKQRDKGTAGNATNNTAYNIIDIEDADIQKRTGGIRLNFISISGFSDGVPCHIGEETIYYEEYHEVVHRGWSSNGKHTAKVLKIPSHIQSEEEVRTYVKQVEPVWMINR